MTTHRFCDEEVGILGHLLLDDDADTDEYFAAFQPPSFFLGHQVADDTTHATARELFGATNDNGLVTPFDVADMAFAELQSSNVCNPVMQRCTSEPSTSFSNLLHVDSILCASPRDASQRLQCRTSNNSSNVNPVRTCSVPGCTKSSQSRGRCIRHGGGKRCSVENCSRGAQVTGRCKAHGGGVRCSVDGCDKSSQGAGLCRTHGGGKICVFPGCKKGTQRHGRCSTHGGARRCVVDGCSKIDRGGGLCGAHKKTVTLTTTSASGSTSA